MAVDLSKVMDLADGLEIYKDLRDRLLAKYEKPSTGIPASDLAAGVIPTVPVTDVQVNSTSILQNGIANIPIAGPDQLGVLKVGSGSRGLNVSSINNELQINFATAVLIKAGANSYCPITPKYVDAAAFYGLASAAGKSMSSVSGATVGTYPDEQKQAIQKMLGLDGILGDFESSAVASKAYAIGETFIYNGKRYRATAAIAISDVITPGTNCVLDPIDGHYVRDTDYASTQKAGLARVSGGQGTSVNPETGVIGIYPATITNIKEGTHNYRPIVPLHQHESVFYALSKLAGVDLASGSDTVGTYPQTAKTAIQTMLGIEADIPLIEEVSGSTPSITGMPNVRYICGTCSLLTITPPVSGSIVVRFTSGSTPTVLTVPNTVKFPVWFDYTSLEADTTYEIIITDGAYGGVMSWAA